jgi:hypothetical protein
LVDRKDAHTRAIRTTLNSSNVRLAQQIVGN